MAYRSDRRRRGWYGPPGWAGPPWAGRPWAGAPWRLTLLVAAFQLIGTTFAAHDQPEKRMLDAVAIGLLLAGPAALALRRRYPVPVLVGTAVITLSYLLLDYPYGPVFLSLAAAFISATVHGHRTVAVGTLVISYAAFGWLGYVLGIHDPPSLVEAVGVTAWLIGLVAVSEVFRTRRERAIEGARLRREESRRRASEERLRIAQELHDVLAHNISLIRVQAGVGSHLIDERPEQARAALEAIKEASDDALGELRSVLDILRDGDRGEAPRSPVPGLRDLPGLIEKTKSAGLDITLETEGEVRPLPPRVDRAAFRIAQEAITNAVRHAGSARAVVRVSYDPDEVVVSVEDDGTGGEVGGTGRGIAGMTERAAALGGELHAGGRDGGGFRVRARLPIDRHANDR